MAVSNPNKPNSVDVKSGTSQSNFTRKAGVSLSDMQCMEQPHNRVATVSTMTKLTHPSTLGVESSKGQSHCTRKAGETLLDVDVMTEEASCSESVTPAASSVPVHPTKPAPSKKLDAQTKAERFVQEKKQASLKHTSKLDAQAGVSQSNSTRKGLSLFLFLASRPLFSILLGQYPVLLRPYIGEYKLII